MSVNRIAIFIDAGYLEKVLHKEFRGAKVDFGKLSSELARGEELLRTYYYNCPPYQSNPPTPEEIKRTSSADSFYAALKRLPRSEVRLGRLAKRSCDKCNAIFFQQKRADLMLGVDMVNVSARHQIAKAILVAGDSDLLPAVTVTKDCGVLVHLYHGGNDNPPHRDLYDACDERTLITRELIDRIRREPEEE